MSEGAGTDSPSWATVLRQILSYREVPAEWPDGDAEMRALAEDMLEMRAFTHALAEGDLSKKLAVKGQLAGTLKALQAALRHLTWQVKQIAAGDLNQRVAFMGEFSAAFNAMTENLSRAYQELRESERRYRLLAENARDVIWTMDLQGRFTYVSPSVEFLRGYTAAEVMRQSITEALTPASASLALEGLSKLLEPMNAEQTAKAPFTFELEQPCKDGTTVWTEVTITLIHDAEGRLVAIQGVSRDISKRRKVEEVQRREHALAEALRDSAAALNSALELDQVLDTILENAHKVVPYDAVDVILLDGEGRVSFTRTSAINQPEAVASIQQLPVDSFANLKKMLETRVPLIIPDTREMPEWRNAPGREWIRSNLGAPIVTNGEVVGFLSMHSAQPGFFTPENAENLRVFANQAAVALQKARLYDRLNYFATTDDLTTIPNRRQFYRQGRLEVERARRYGHPLAALMLDIDYFKRVNDTCGHAAGDQVLRGVAACCQSSLRKVDLIGRYGGEEFVFLLPETGPDEARQAAERLRSVVEKTVFETACGAVNVTVSVGVAQLLMEEDNLDRLLDRADSAMYTAKSTGRNRVVVYS